MRKNKSRLHEHILEIIDDLDAKLSYSKIAKKYNVSIGSIAGFISREIHNNKELNEVQNVVRIKVISTATEKKFNKIDFNTKDPLVEYVKSNQCKFPIGDPKKKDFKFCTNIQKVESVYCKEHHQLCYIKIAPMVVHTHLYK